MAKRKTLHVKHSRPKGWKRAYFTAHLNLISRMRRNERIYERFYPSLIGAFNAAQSVKYVLTQGTQT
jgi:hypothetical protein